MAGERGAATAQILAVKLQDALSETRISFYPSRSVFLKLAYHLLSVAMLSDAKRIAVDAWPHNVHSRPGN